VNKVPKKRNQQFMEDLDQLRMARLENLNSNQKLTYLNQKNSRARIMKYQVVWYAATLIMYGWFLGSIAYEIFAWHKLITAVGITNYIGAITAMALIWAGSIIFTKPPVSVPQFEMKRKTAREKIFKNKIIERKTIIKRAPKSRTRQTRITTPVVEKAPLIKLKTTQTQQQFRPKQEPKVQSQNEPMSLLKLNTVSVDSKCSHQIRNSLEIPSACLTCKDLFRCLSKPKK
jgi:hypothetical protein